MIDNNIVVEAWNTVLFDKFVRFKHLLIAGLAGTVTRCSRGARSIPAIVSSISAADSATAP